MAVSMLNPRSIFFKELPTERLLTLMELNCFGRVRFQKQNNPLFTHPSRQSIQLSNIQHSDRVPDCPGFLSDLDCPHFTNTPPTLVVRLSIVRPSCSHCPAWLSHPPACSSYHSGSSVRLSIVRIFWTLQVSSHPGTQRLIAVLTCGEAEGKAKLSPPPRSKVEHLVAAHIVRRNKVLDEVSTAIARDRVVCNERLTCGRLGAIFAALCKNRDEPGDRFSRLVDLVQPHGNGLDTLSTS